MLVDGEQCASKKLVLVEQIDNVASGSKVREGATWIVLATVVGSARAGAHGARAFDGRRCFCSGTACACRTTVKDRGARLVRCARVVAHVCDGVMALLRCSRREWSLVVVEQCLRAKCRCSCVLQNATSVRSCAKVRCRKGAGLKSARLRAAIWCVVYAFVKN